MSGYREDLAYVHDAGFSGFVRGAMPGLLKILRRHHICEGLVIDLGCGSGIAAHELTRAGYEVLGVDISAAMLRLARARAPGARFVRASLFRVKLPPCVAVTAVGECVNYLFERGNNRRRLGKLFRRVYQSLVPGGVFVFDIATPGRARTPLDRYFQGRDWAIFVHNQEDMRSLRLTRRMVIFRKVGRNWRRSVETHTQELYPVQLVTSQLLRAGFKVQQRSGYGARPLGAGAAVLVAQRLRH
jgi:SAM-dependent methyltransferase